MPSQGRIDSLLHEHVSCELLLTTKCNLSCSYCIAKSLPLKRMTEEIAMRAADMFMYLAEGASSIEITFTGGEPLLQFPLIQSLTEWFKMQASQRGMSSEFVLKTNGTIFNEEILEFMRLNRVRVVVSIDGPREIQDENRRSKTGIGSYDDVCRNISVLIANGVACVASLTVHPRSAHAVTDSVRHLQELGLVDINVGPAYGTVQWTKKSTKALTEALNKIAAIIRESSARDGQLEVGPIYRQSEHVGGQLCDAWGCHAASSNLAFLPDGGVTGCSALAMLVPNFPDLLIGDVWNGLDEGALAKMLQSAQAGLWDRPKCLGCVTAANCTGGCLAINYATTGAPFEPPDFYCRIISAIPSAWHQAWD
jgi:uncharacterized protein